MRNNFKSCFPVIIILFCFFTCIHAQEKPDEVIEKFVESIGGVKEMAKIRNIRSIADCDGPNGKYITEVYSAKNSRLVFKQKTDNGRTFTGFVNGETFWTVNEKTGDVSIAGKQMASIWRGHEFQMIAVELPKRYLEPVFEGYENFAGFNSIKLRVTDEFENPVNAFFNKDTKLLSGFILNPDGKKEEQIRILFNEWKTIGKVKLPSKITAIDNSGSFVLNFHTIALNKIDEQLFSITKKVTATSELLNILKQERAAHFNRDAKLLVSMMADDYLEISAGRINQPTTENILKRFQSYFDRTTFIEWDDITPPIIKVSEDATMAYAIVKKQVHAQIKNDKDEVVEVKNVFAWIATYRKLNGKWQLAAIASTNEPTPN